MRLVQNPGRVAGLWYLLLILLGPLRLIYIPAKLFISGDAAATVGNIAMHERLFRWGIASDLAAAVVLILLTLAFHQLFAATDRNLARMVVIFGGILPAALYLVGAAIDLGALAVIAHPAFLSVFLPAQQDALAMLLLRLHSVEITAAETLWGVWLLPVAALVYRSRFLPRFLGVWLAAGGVAYIAVSLAGVLWPAYQGRISNLSQPFTFAEVALTLWLLLKGSSSTTAAQGF